MNALRYVRSFALTVLDLLHFGTIRWVARYLGVGWDMVKGIHKSKLRVLYRKIPLHKVRYMGIDEFSKGKGHEYMTVVTDLRTGRILHAIEGKGKEDILPFLRKLARKGKRLEAVAMDMSSAYYQAVREAPILLTYHGTVIPVQAGIRISCGFLDPGLRRGDVKSTTLP